MELFWLNLSLVSSCDISCMALNICSMALHIVKIKLTLKLFSYTFDVFSQNCSPEETFKGEKGYLSVMSTAGNRKDKGSHPQYIQVIWNLSTDLVIYRTVL